MIPCLRYQAPAGAADRVLLIMLPGAGIEAAAFAEHGMVAELHAQGWPVDVVAAQPALEQYLDGEVAGALHEDIVRPAVAQGYRRIWLLGISMGGMGALLYASAHAPVLEGVILLAPFLGTQGTVAEIAKAGGLIAWPDAASNAVDMERRALIWLRHVLAEGRPSPLLYLGYGTDDRFAPGHIMLAQALPADRVIRQAGGHDWETWRALWRRLLETAPFTAPARTLL